MAGKHKNLIYDQWLARTLKRDVYKLVVDDDLVKRARNYDRLKELQDRSVFIYSKVSPEALSAVKFLEEQGFNLIDTNIVFEKPIAPSENCTANCDLRFTIPEDQNQVVELARRSFVYSRFHLDSAFPREVADMIKAEWVGSYFTGNRGDTMVVALAGDVIIGFLLLIYGEDGTLVIDLIAVDEKYRRKGVAEDMIAFAESQCHGFTQIRVGTQLANAPSLRLYEGMRFKITAAQYTFHYHHV
ncbi:MAG: GNAT family N-acetyltransferase [Chloroflexi bacterium]|nr:GNAT family N-acetyltransferase [Chloroflexota bacterium]